jgi:hypothetical protein
MFNMIVKYSTWADGCDSIPLNRVFEYTEASLVAHCRPGGQLNFPALIELPTLFVQGAIVKSCVWKAHAASCSTRRPSLKTVPFMTAGR